MVVTGSRIPRPDLQKQGNVSVMAERSPEPANSAAPTAAYGQFLSRLQAAVRAGKKGAVVRLVETAARSNATSTASSRRVSGRQSSTNAPTACSPITRAR